MSDTYKLFGARLTALTPREEHVVLPFPGPKTGASDFSLDVSGNGHSHPKPDALPLIKALCDALDEERISYCHWKGNWRLHRWLRGEGDLDLLISSDDANRFLNLVSRLGFKQAEPDAAERIPGLANFYGWDNAGEKFVHVQAYFRLSVGDDETFNYHLPIERSVLESAERDGVIAVPPAELEIVTFVIRKALSYSALENALRHLCGRRTDNVKNAAELDHLESKTNKADVDEILVGLFPAVDAALFQQCVQSIRLDASTWLRISARRRLQRLLSAHSRRNSISNGVLRWVRMLSRTINDKSAKHLVNGGAIVAIVGGDGSGKTTAVSGLKDWLSEHFLVQKFHIGKPKRSLITFSVIIALRMQRAFRRLLKSNNLRTYHGKGCGYLQQLRWACAARDRFHVYARARRFASNGGVAVCDRYVLPNVRLMDGPNIEHALAGENKSWFSRLLLKMETHWYTRILPPDLLFVLRVDPEIAVQRKRDEHEDHVRSRSREIWRINWDGTRASVIDAGQTSAAVMAELRSAIWQRL